MHDLQIRHIPADLLDHLVLDMCELESLVERLIRSLDSADIEAFPRDPTVVQLLDLLSRMEEASGTLHRTAHDRIRSVASALSADCVVDGKPVRQSRDRVVVDDRGIGGMTLSSFPPPSAGGSSTMTMTDSMARVRSPQCKPKE